MLKLFLIFSILFCNNLFSQWHWGGNPPKKGQLVIFVIQDPKTLLMTHYDPKTMKCMLQPRGWFDVNETNLWEWVEQNYTIYYIPGDSETDWWED